MNTQRPVGYNSWCLAGTDVISSIEIAKSIGATAMEFSLTGHGPLLPYIHYLLSLDISTFDYVSAHAPVPNSNLSEEEIVKSLYVMKTEGWQFVMHPDAIRDFELWRTLGDSLILENMDIHKQDCRSTDELALTLSLLPEARVCIDLAHVINYDPSGKEAKKMLKAFRGRLAEFHISGMNSDGTHRPLPPEDAELLRSLKRYIPKSTPIIIESADRNIAAQSEMLDIVSSLFV